MKQKGILAFLLVLVSFLFLCSCSTPNKDHKSKYTVKGCVERDDRSGFSADYQEMKGVRYYSIKVKEEEVPLSIKVDTKTESGKLHLTVGKDGEMPIYEGNEKGSTTSSTLIVKDAGTYWVTLEAEAHKGGYAFSW